LRDLLTTAGLKTGNTHHEGDYQIIKPLVATFGFFVYPVYNCGATVIVWYNGEVQDNLDITSFVPHHLPTHKAGR